MEIKFSNGLAVIKTFVNRGLRKKIRVALYSGVDGKMDIGEQKQTFEGWNATNMDNANDVALVGMVEKLVINDKEISPITLQSFDEMNDDDCELIIDAINKITKKK